MASWIWHEEKLTFNVLNWRGTLRPTERDAEAGMRRGSKGSQKETRGNTADDAQELLTAAATSTKGKKK